MLQYVYWITQKEVVMINVNLDDEFLDLFFKITNSNVPKEVNLINMKNQLNDSDTKDGQSIEYYNTERKTQKIPNFIDNNNETSGEDSINLIYKDMNKKELLNQRITPPKHNRINTLDHCTVYWKKIKNYKIPNYY